ncbi:MULTISPECIES: DUF5133 domain-containing protein [unclassified Streptomyces]|uniref:DUF5133 domain-containing protein n=1 Tax=unclassified Streptomyces TaxID=2593676 RepID=UPI00365B4C84
MLEADPMVLRTLLARYAEARFAYAHSVNARTAEALDEVADTLCAATASATVEEAIAAADMVLESARNGGPVLVGSPRPELAAS